MRRFLLSLVCALAVIGGAWAVQVPAPIGGDFGDFSQMMVRAFGGSTYIALAERFGWSLTPQDFGAKGNGVNDDTAAIQSALNAGASAVVTIPGGAYLTTAPLVAPSNTKIRCLAGATIESDNSVTPQIENTNYNAATLTDHDISIEGCSWIYTGTLSGSSHHIQMRMASNIYVTQNSFTGGGDGTAMLATQHTVVSDNSMTDARNACWDQWEAATDFSVKDNYCSTRLYGVLGTGTNTAHNTAGQAIGGSIRGNYIYVTGGSYAAAIWLNGQGLAGSGASQSVVSDNVIAGDGTMPFTCIEVSGTSSDDSVLNNICKNSGPNSAGLVAAIGGDPGGAPSNIRFIGNILDGMQIASGNIGAIELRGSNTEANDNRVIGGNYPSCVWLGSSNDVALRNNCDPGTGILFNTNGATNPMYGLDGGLAKLFEVDAGNTSGSIQFTNIPASTHPLLLTCDGLKPASNTGVTLQVGEGGGSTAWKSANYDYSLVGQNPNLNSGAPTAVSGTSATAVTLYYTNDVGSAHAFNMKAWLNLPSGMKSNMYFNVAYDDSASGAPTTLTGSASYVGDNNQITAVEINSSTGNWASGSCSLYILN